MTQKKHITYQHKEKNKKCPYCNSCSKKFISQTDINQKMSENTFHVNKCQFCNLVYIVNPPENLGVFYPKAIYFQQPKDRKELKKESLKFQKRIDFLLKHKKGGSLLEIGPSYGHFCLLAQDAGFDVSAIEMDKDCVQFLSKKLGVKAVHSNKPNEVLKENATKYDAICLWHSLEHLPEPWDIIKNAAQRLNPDGIMIIASPNPKSIQIKYMGSKWPHFDLPRHLFLMSINWLEHVAEKARLKLVFKTTKDIDGQDFNRISWGMYLQSLGFSSALTWRFAALVSALFSPLENRGGYGSCYVTVFQKRSECD